MKRRDACFKCCSRSCFIRIFADGFDEVACREHSRDLENYADEVLNGAVRKYVLSSQKQIREKRGKS